MILNMSRLKEERIAKVMARAGLCSRREAEKWVRGGRVCINGKVISEPGINVRKNDTILVDNQPLPQSEATRLWRYYKPSGLVSTNIDPEGRATIFEKLPKELPRVITVGRLDITSEGLLLLTNDGELARKLELPKTRWVRRYRARVHGHVVEDRLLSLSKGVSVDGVHYGPIAAKIDSQKKSNAWLDLRLREGKNREIRKVMGFLGLDVTRLIRIAYGPFQLGKMNRGQVIEITGKVIRDQISGLHKPKTLNGGSE